MATVILDMSMSVDGFVTGPGDRVGLPLGEGGSRLHDWVFGGTPDRTGTSPRDSASGVNARVLTEAFENSGAVVMGRRTFDVGEGPWGEQPPFEVPCFVLTHQPLDPVKKDGGTTFTFVSEGIEHAVDLAKDAAGSQQVGIMGAQAAQQCLRAGLIDELHLHIVPVLLGAGTRLFEHLGTSHIELEPGQVIEGPGVTHLRYRVAR